MRISRHPGTTCLAHVGVSWHNDLCNASHYVSLTIEFDKFFIDFGSYVCPIMFFLTFSFLQIILIHAYRVLLCSTKHKPTMSYHPQTNGLTERLNPSLTDMLEKCLENISRSTILIGTLPYPMSLLHAILHVKTLPVIPRSFCCSVENPHCHWTHPFHPPQQRPASMHLTPSPGQPKHAKLLTLASWPPKRSNGVCTISNTETSTFCLDRWCSCGPRLITLACQKNSHFGTQAHIDSCESWLQLPTKSPQSVPVPHLPWIPLTLCMSHASNDTTLLIFRRTGTVLLPPGIMIHAYYVSRGRCTRASRWREQTLPGWRAVGWTGQRCSYFV